MSSISAPMTTTGRLRLTRRGQVIMLAAALLVAMMLGVFFGAGSMATGRGGSPEPTRVVMVTEGETLWGIASAAAGDGSTRDMIAKIERLNALETAMVTAGQQLRIPIEP